MRKSLWTAAAASLMSLVFALSGSAADWFARSVSRPLSAALSKAASVTAWPVGETLLVVGAPAILLLLIWASVRRKPPKAAAFALSVLFFAYAVLWVPLCFEPANPAEPYETWRLMKLCQVLSDQAEGLRPEAREAPEEATEALLEAARDSVAALSLNRLPLQTPKISRFPGLLRALKIAGLYAPWTGEAIVSPDEPDFTLPFLAAHELAHAAGVAREDEANFIAYRACLRGDARFQYAGTIYALRYAMDVLRVIDMGKWLEIRRSFAEGVRADFTRIDDLGDAAAGFSAFSDRAAEAFLRLSGQPAGLASYTGMVNFLLSDVSLVDDPQTLQREDAVQYID